MDLRTDLTMRPEQRLVMTPRLQQALKLLELNTLELDLVVQQELMENPALELEEPDQPEEGESPRDEEPEAPAAGEAAAGEEGEPPAAPETAQSAEGPEAPESEPPEREEPDWEELLPAGAADGDGDYRREEREQDDEPYQRVLTSSVSLRDHLLEQLRIATNDEARHRMGEFIIGSLDDRGYFVSTLEEVAQASGAPAAEVEAALRMVQTFDPSGVAARDLRECLLLQLAAEGEGDGVAARIVREHLEDLLQKRFGEIARRARLSPREIERAVARIATLDPKPGYRFETEPPPYITPDLLVERVDDDFVVTLNDRHQPRLRISSSYQNLLRSARERADGSREFLAKKMDAARWLIDIIEQRRRTMLKVMRDIVEYQRDFFEHGPAHLKPMTLNQVAERIGMHESTVSRVTRAKYAQTPHGVFELKYFFSPGLRTDSGEDVSSRRVKGKLQELVNAEDPRNPLSDQQLVDKLNEEGYRVARRTVAKYREQLRILPARMRRQG